MRRRLLVLLALGALALVGGGAWLARAEDGRLPPAVVVGGVEVGGRSLAEARALVARAAGRRAREPIRLLWERGSLEVSGAALGARAEVDRALAKAMRSRDAWSRLAARLGLSGERRFPLAFRLHPASFGALLDFLRPRVERPARSARVERRGGALVVVPPRTGLALDARALEARLPRLPAALRVPVRPLPPEIGEAAALRAKARAERLLRRPPAVVLGERRFELGRSLLLQALRFRSVGTGLAVSLDPAPLAGPLRRAFRRFETEPRAARFRVTGDRVVVLPGRAGSRVAPEKIAAALVERAGAAEVRARFEPVVPRLTTAEARAMRIRELVSKFTTPYACCPPRVTNIRRAAEILDGTVIPAGGAFSLNRALGPRTRERGFVVAPMILRGRLVDAVGGGVSQVATTVYNAAFFAGLDLVEHTPHQFYISRYPMGREATVSWGGPDLVFRNDWPAAILVKVFARPTSITVRFYSSRLGRRVETETGEPYARRPPRVRTVVNRSLPPRTRRTVQHGGVAGFSVRYTRRVYRGGRLLRKERFLVRYDPEDTIVEVGPKPKPKPKKPARTPAKPIQEPSGDRSFRDAPPAPGGEGGQARRQRDGQPRAT